MTEENYNYRTSQTLLRNQFPGKGKLKIPIIPKFQEKPGDFDNLLLIRFLYKGIIIKHNKTEPTYTKTSLFLCEKRRFFMARTEKGVVTTI